MSWVGSPDDFGGRLPEALARRERTAQRDAASLSVEFATAPFGPHGLDDGWAGLRWFGGRGSSSGQVQRLGLAHGDAPWDPMVPQVRVDTICVAASDDPRLDRSSNRWMVPRQLVQWLWRRSGVLDESVRQAAFPHGAARADPTGPWERVGLVVNEAVVPARLLSVDEAWVAIANLGETLVTIEAARWPLDQTRVVTVEDLTPYEEGAVELTRRRPVP